MDKIKIDTSSIERITTSFQIECSDYRCPAPGCSDCILCSDTDVQNICISKTPRIIMTWMLQHPDNWEEK